LTAARPVGACSANRIKPQPDCATHSVQRGGEKIRERVDIEWAYLVTDSEESFASMRRSLGAKYHCVQLYKSYLENFRINLPDALSDGAPK